MSERRRTPAQGRETDTITIRMSRALRARIIDLAERERRSQTVQIEILLEEALAARAARGEA